MALVVKAKRGLPIVSGHKVIESLPRICSARWTLIRGRA